MGVWRSGQKEQKKGRSLGQPTKEPSDPQLPQPSKLSKKVYKLTKKQCRENQTTRAPSSQEINTTERKQQETNMLLKGLLQSKRESSLSLSLPKVQEAGPPTYGEYIYIYIYIYFFFKINILLFYFYLSAYFLICCVASELL